MTNGLTLSGGGKKISHIPDVALRLNGRPGDGQEWDTDKKPVEQTHDATSSEDRIWNRNCASSPFHMENRGPSVVVEVEGNARRSGRKGILEPEQIRKAWPRKWSIQTFQQQVMLSLSPQNLALVNAMQLAPGALTNLIVVSKKSKRMSAAIPAIGRPVGGKRSPVFRVACGRGDR